MELLRGLDGLTEPEAKELALQHLPDIVFKKLKDPHVPLTVEQQIECLCSCVSVGAARALKASEKSVLIVIGNTGAGKSTFVNYVHGCPMESFKTEKGKKAIRVKLDSDELMPIGHNNQSMTFIPGIESDESFTYMDCPGFMDNRGAEINIANAVNIKQAIHKAESVVVAVILNYHTLLSERGKGLRDLAAILQDMFGNGERLANYTSAIALGVSRVPPRDEDGDMNSLELVEQSLQDLSGLSTSEADVVRALRSRVFMFDPANRGDNNLGWSSREDLITLFSNLDPITEPSSIFQTVLTPEDERALRIIVQEMTRSISTAMDDEDYEAIGTMLAQLQRIECVDNPLITRLMGQAKDCVRSSLMQLREDASQAIIYGDVEGVERYLGSLRAAASALEPHAPEQGRVAQQAAEKVQMQLQHFLEMAEERKALRRELESSRESRELLQKQLKQLETEQAWYGQEVSRLQDKMDLVREAKAKEMEALTRAFTQDREKLEARLESASDKDKKKLHQEIERLRAEQEQSRCDLEERAREQEEKLQQALGENKRLISERELQAVGVRKQEAELVKQENCQKEKRVVQQEIEEKNRLLSERRRVPKQERQKPQDAGYEKWRMEAFKVRRLRGSYFGMVYPL